MSLRKLGNDLFINALTFAVYLLVRDVHYGMSRILGESW